MTFIMSFPLAPFICSLPATTLTPVKCQARKGGGSGWKRTNLHGNVDGKRWYSFGNRENFQIQFGDIFLSPPSLTHSTPPCTQTSLPHPSSTSSSELSGATQGVAVGHKTRSDIHFKHRPVLVCRFCGRYPTVIFYGEDFVLMSLFHSKLFNVMVSACGMFMVLTRG